MPVCEYEKLEQCPYEKSHLVTPDKLITHLTKCRKQHLKKHPTPNIVVCPYKSTHHVALAELDYHVKNCDGKDLAIHMLLEPSTAKVRIPEASISVGPRDARNSEVVTDDEDWETQQIRAPYDPAAKILDKEVIRKPVGLTKAERKEFVVKERERRRFLAGRKEAKELADNGIDKEFARNVVIRQQSTTQKFLYNTEARTSDEEKLEQMATLRRPKLVATPTRAIYAQFSKNEDILEPLPQPRLRRPNCVTTPTMKDSMGILDEKNEVKEDHYDKYVAEKIKQLNI